MNKIRTATLVAVGTAGLCALTCIGATAASWSSDVSTTSAAIRDAAVSFAVDGEAATAQDPSVAIDLGPQQAQTLVGTGHLAVAYKVEALAQGNRGLSYTVDLPEFAPDSIFAAASLTIFRVDTAASCTASTAIPASPSLVSTPVPPSYSDSATPTTEYWCLRGDLSASGAAGIYTSTGTITAEHALGEIKITEDWRFIVNSVVSPETEPTVTLTFDYETIRAGAGS